MKGRNPTKLYSQVEYTKCIKSSVVEWKEQQVFMKFPLKILRYLALSNFFVAGDMSFIK